MAYRAPFKRFCAILQEIPGLGNVSWNIYVALVVCAAFHKKGGPREGCKLLQRMWIGLFHSTRSGRRVISGAAMYLQLKSVMLTREELVILILENIFFTLMEISLTLDFIFLESLLQIKRKKKKSRTWFDITCFKNSCF